MSFPYVYFLSTSLTLQYVMNVSPFCGVLNKLGTLNKQIILITNILEYINI